MFARSAHVSTFVAPNPSVIRWGGFHTEPGHFTPERTTPFTPADVPRPEHDQPVQHAGAVIRDGLPRSGARSLIGLRGGGGDAGASGNVRELQADRRRELEGKRNSLRSRESELLQRINQFPQPALDAQHPPVAHVYLRNIAENELRHVRHLLQSVEQELRHLPQ
ncbi:hypothetical protein [Paraburkholderia humisilvae]|uniref:Uncharacterized protein n=1 Tax=Paraburkholderia humisilvae TaxID=627669 RepID=A0A6J5DDU1_9BURK|nr:hypothetical protein [Paraburkholderia humisilvae]CAB3752123.1 hypothetical protein LMG29542_01689 [Paraburkholderia humisilvae]